MNTKVCSECGFKFSDLVKGDICPTCVGRNLARDQWLEAHKIPSKGTLSEDRSIDLHKITSTGKDIDDAVSKLLVEKKLEPKSLRSALSDMLALIDEHGDRSLIKAHATRIAEARITLGMENISLKAVLEDFANNGVRHDLMPTLCISGETERETQEKLITFFYRYIESIDSYVRKTSRNALDNSIDILN